MLRCTPKMFIPAMELASAGMNIFGVHLDRRANMPNVARVRDEIAATGKENVFFNINAADDNKRQSALDEMQKTLKEKGGPSTIRVFVHSLAFGSLGRYFTAN